MVKLTQRISTNHRLVVATIASALSFASVLTDCVLGSKMGDSPYVGQCNDPKVSSLCNQSTLGRQAICFCGNDNKYEAKITCADRGHGPLTYQDGACYPSPVSNPDGAVPSGSIGPNGDAGCRGATESCARGTCPQDELTCNNDAGRTLDAGFGTRDAGRGTQDSGSGIDSGWDASMPSDAGYTYIDGGCRGATESCARGTCPQDELTCNNDAGRTRDAGSECTNGDSFTRPCDSASGFVGNEIVNCVGGMLVVNTQDCHLVPPVGDGGVVFTDAGRTLDAGRWTRDSGSGIRDSGQGTDSGWDASMPSDAGYTYIDGGRDAGRTRDGGRGTGTDAGRILDAGQGTDGGSSQSCTPRTECGEVNLSTNISTSTKSYSCDSDGGVHVQENPCGPNENCEVVDGTPSCLLPPPVLHLTFNEGSGSIAFDNSGNNNHGTLDSSGVSWISYGKLGGAVQFTGSGGIRIPDSSSLNPSSRITLSTWANYSPSAVNDAPGLIQKASAAHGYSLGIYHVGSIVPSSVMATQDNFNPWHIIGCSSGYPNCNANISSYAWHHIAATYGDGFYRLYLDGVIINTVTRGPSDIIASPTDLYVGICNNNGVCQNFTGAVDDVRVYNDVTLTTRQIGLLYNNGAGTEVTRPKAP